MAKFKRRAKRSGRSKVTGAAVRAGRTAPTSGLKDVRPPEPNTHRIEEEVLARAPCGKRRGHTGLEVPCCEQLWN